MKKNKFLIGLKFFCLNKYHKIANLWIFQFVTLHLVLSSQKFAGNTYYQNASKDISAFLVFIFENCSGFVASVPLKWINYKFLYIRVTLSYSLEFLYYETAVFDFSWYIYRRYVLSFTEVCVYNNVFCPKFWPESWRSGPKNDGNAYSLDTKAFNIFILLLLFRCSCVKSFPASLETWRQICIFPSSKSNSSKHSRWSQLRQSWICSFIGNQRYLSYFLSNVKDPDPCRTSNFITSLEVTKVNRLCSFYTDFPSFGSPGDISYKNSKRISGKGFVKWALKVMVLLEIYL